MKLTAIIVFSLFVGYVLGSVATLALAIAGLNIPAWFARTYTQYNSYQGAEVLLFMIVFGWVTYRILARRFLPRSARTIETETVPANWGETH